MNWSGGSEEGLSKMWTYQSETYLTPELVTKPTSEPLSLSEAKKQLEISETDSSHDDHLWKLITAAREQFEHDTDSVMCYQTWRVKTDRIYDCMKLPKRPIVSLTSIYYYSTANVSTLLSSSVYQIDTARRELRLGYSQSWPSTIGRWDDYTILYKLGYSVDGRSVPAVAKQAMLLLIGHYFENRDMLVTDNMVSNRAYEALVARYMRSSYP